MTHAKVRYDEAANSFVACKEAAPTAFYYSASPWEVDCPKCLGILAAKLPQPTPKGTP